jgi:hypothetical protein
MDKLNEYGTKWNIFDSIWLVRADMSVVEMRDTLKEFMASGDKLIVIDVTGDPAAWRGLNPKGSEWLVKYL